MENDFLKMKRMIISPAQLKAINEAAAMNNIVGGFNGTRNDLNVQVLNSTPAMQKNGGVGTIVNQNNPAGPTVSLGPTTTDQEISKAGKILATTGDNTNQASALEETRYSKRQVELGRMLEMRKNGKVFSKKQLNEMFMETQDNAERLRNGFGNCDVFTTIDAVKEFFPEYFEGFVEAFKNGSDALEYIINNIFGRSDINGEREEKFLKRLGL